MTVRRLGALFLVAGLVGCGPFGAPAPVRPGIEGLALVAVLPFRVGGQLDQHTAFASRSDLAAVPDELGDRIARRLAVLLADAGVAVVDPEAVISATPVAGAGIYDTRLATRVGKKVGANLAVLGAITRYDERKGTAWGVEVPATVWYQDVLVRVSDGAVIVRDRFEYTQQPLSGNLLELPQFLEGGGRWVTREQMLSGALRRTAKRLTRSILAGTSR